MGRAATLKKLRKMADRAAAKRLGEMRFKATPKIWFRAFCACCSVLAFFGIRVSAETMRRVARFGIREEVLR